MIEYLIARDFQDDEIEDEFDHVAKRSHRGQNLAFTRSGDFVDWSTLRGRRQVLAILANIRGAASAKLRPAPEGTPANVLAERERRLAAREPYGYQALAEHFVLGKTTIRRRLGKAK